MFWGLDLCMLSHQRKSRWLLEGLHHVSLPAGRPCWIITHILTAFSITFFTQFVKKKTGHLLLGLSGKVFTFDHLFFHSSDFSTIWQFLWLNGQSTVKIDAWALAQTVNPTTHLSIKPRWKLNGAGKVWDELSNYKTLLRVEWEIFTQRRVTRIFLVNNLKYFSIRLFLFQNNSTASALQLPFTIDLQKKVVVSIIRGFYLHRLCSITSMLTQSRRIKLAFISCKVQ